MAEELQCGMETDNPHNLFAQLLLVITNYPYKVNFGRETFTAYFETAKV